MKKQQLTSEIVQVETYFYEDSAYLEAETFVDVAENDWIENEEVWAEAVRIADEEFLPGYELIEIESQGSSSRARAIWQKTGRIDKEISQTKQQST